MYIYIVCHSTQTINFALFYYYYFVLSNSMLVLLLSLT